ncbi:MAG TPA: fatty acid desaturase CarF family protein [Pyrinomonadaceae bacterium]|nr:fatty acid desaturase CarF family protein [Pyrinomonadaceae bacterium]
MNQRPLTVKTARAVESTLQPSQPLSSVQVLPAGEGYSGLEEKSGPLHSILEHAMTLAFPLLCAASLYLAARELGWLSIAIVLVVGVPVAWILADFVSGLVHWFADTYGADDTPLFGPWLIKPFRQHHQYARDICTHNLVLTIGNSCTVAAPFQAGVLYLLLSDEDVSFTKAAFSFVFNLFTIAMVATNVLHKWAHAEKTNWVISRLQRSRVFLSPAHHHLHHTKPFDSNYCITNGWLNPLLEKIHFFRRLEWMLSKVRLHPSVNAYDRGKCSLGL